MHSPGCTRVFSHTLEENVKTGRKLLTACYRVRVLLISVAECQRQGHSAEKESDNWGNFV